MAREGDDSEGTEYRAQGVKQPPKLAADSALGPVDDIGYSRVDETTRRAVRACGGSGAHLPALWKQRPTVPRIVIPIYLVCTQFSGAVSTRSSALTIEASAAMNSS